jgi:DNA-directed RNA polymerase alpha subunit
MPDITGRRRRKESMRDNKEAYQKIKERMQRLREEKKAKEIIAFGVPLTARCRNIFRILGVKTVGQLGQLSERYILKHRNVGIKTIEEIKNILKKNGMELAAGGGGTEERPGSGPEAYEGERTVLWGHPPPRRKKSG